MVIRNLLAGAQCVGAALVVLLLLASTAFAQQQRDVRGLVAAANQVIISSELSARILKLPFREGEAFKRGELLIKFDCALHNAELRSARAELLARRKKHENDQELSKLNAIGNIDVDLSAAEAKRASAAVSVAAIRTKQCAIKAPFDGRVVERHASASQSVVPDQELLKIVDSGQLVVELIVPSNWLTWLKPGQAFSFIVDETGHQHTAEVDRLGAVVDAVSHTIKVYGRFKEQTSSVLAGMSGTARFAAQGG